MDERPLTDDEIDELLTLAHADTRSGPEVQIFTPAEHERLERMQAPMREGAAGIIETWLRAGLSLQEAANLIGESRRTVTNWLNGTPVRERMAARIGLADSILNEHAGVGASRERMMQPSVQTPDGHTTSPYRAALKAARGLSGRRQESIEDWQ
jgi:hypothetical protein